ncbi:MAG: hypothetical protein MJZ25_11100 [Fibrobacter sp.]|nr:hypothetical protein [Fibrobacter sp.]
MNKIKLLPFLGMAILAACTSEESISNPNGESKWNSQFPISIDQSENSLTMQIDYYYNACQLIKDGEKYSTKWDTMSLQFTLEMQYTLTANKLTMWQKEEGPSSALTYTKVGGDNSLYGTWNYDSSEDVMEITDKFIYTTEQSNADNSEQEPVESEIDLANSYFIYDLYSCGAEGYNCNFGHWHFTKKAPDFLEDMIYRQGIVIHESTDRFQRLSFKGKEITVNVEHVQLDSLNDGNALISATIQIQGDTCNFRHADLAPTKELCKAENAEDLATFAYSDEDGKIYSTSYVIDNSDEFALCVSRLLN